MYVQMYTNQDEEGKKKQFKTQSKKKRSYSQLECVTKSSIDSIFFQQQQCVCIYLSILRSTQSMCIHR